jgi:hypothetical protein
MSPDDKKHETRFKCPNCQQPIVSRFTFCKQCETKFGRDTLFSCPRCGALVRQLERVCPGCQARLTDWGVGAEWLGTPLASASQKIETPKEIEPGPIISKPLPELKKPEQVEQIPKPAPAPTPLPELKKPDRPDQSRKLTSAPTQKPAPSKITRAEALGRTNGLKHGRVNGTKQGLVNGTKKGLVNGNRNGLVNGTKQGLVNGTSRGRVNGTNKGLVNGTKQGRVNGFKGLKVGEVEEEQSFLMNKIAGKVPTWQALTAIIVVLILVSSAVILTIQPGTVETGIVIDGRFSDWASISSYQLSDILPGNIPQIIESKMNVSGGKTNVYMKLQDNAFSGSTPSSYYVLIDADSNADTGYLLTEHQFGADRMVTLSGWDGRLMETIDSNFTDSSDTGNWSGWYGLHYTSIIQSQSEIEMSIPYSSANPLIRIMTVGALGEFSTPIMSNHGTIVAKQTSLLTGQLATSASQSVIRVSVRAMGVPAGNCSVTATISNATGTDLASQILQVSASSWTTADFTVNLSSLDIGESFSVKARLSSTEFSGPLDVDGESIKGYYLSTPSGIVIDGVFGDWTSKKIADIDTVVVENPNIDIAEYGACTQNSSHFFYAGMVGEALGGADVPEERVKPSGGGGGQPPVVRLKKTGEDLLQAFIDTDPGNGTGQIVNGGGKIIQADYMVEIFGRKGHVTSSSVMQWSDSTHKWSAIGKIDKVGLGGKGIEFSVAKSLLRNLTDSEVIFYTTDWKARSDNCWFTGTLKDPWVITSTGSSYQSLDGITWASSGSITLQGSGSNADTKIVDMISNVARNRVWAVSDHGRVYTNVTGSNTWTSNLTNDLRSAPTGQKAKPQGVPISDVIAITTYKTGPNNFIYLLTKRGYLYFSKAIDQSSSDLFWDNDTRRVGPFTDYDDIWYANPNYYVMRSASNTPVCYAGTAGNFANTTATGSSRTQTHMTIYPGASQATDTIFVLTDHGDIRRSTNGGTSWATFGNLPTPNGANSSTVYVGITLDPSNIIWVTTDTGWVWKSTAALGGTFVCTGRPVTAGVVAIVGLNTIPEFGDMLIPICMAMVIPAVIITRNRRSRRGESDAD